MLLKMKETFGDMYTPTLAIYPNINQSTMPFNFNTDITLSASFYTV